MQQKQKNEPKPCTCHPDERFYPCMRQYAYGDCKRRMEAQRALMEHMRQAHAPRLNPVEEAVLVLLVAGALCALLGVIIWVLCHVYL